MLTLADVPDDCLEAGWDPVELAWVPDDVQDATPAPVPSPAADEDGDPQLRAGRRLLSEVVEEQRIISAAQARLAQVLASMVALYGAPCAEPLRADARVLDDEARAGAAGQVAEEVGAALTLTGYSAHQLVERATHLSTVVPATMAALAAGDLDWRRASIIAEATSALPEAVAAEVDRRLCGPRGSGLDLTSGALPAEIDRVLHEIDRAALIERSRRKAAERRVGRRNLPDGMAEFVAIGPAPAVHAIAAAAHVLGEQSRTAAREGRSSGDPYAVPGIDDGKDGRGIDAHRFDALHTALTTAMTTAAASPSRGGPVPVELQVHLSTLLGADDEPGHLNGYGLLPAWLVRAAEPHGRLRRLLSDPLTGQLVAVDGHTHPPGWLSGTEANIEGDDPGGSPGGTPGGSPGGSPGDGPDRGPGGSGGSGGWGGGPPEVDAGAAQDCAPVDTSACPVATAGGGSYRIPAALARLARRRWGRCTAPRCHRAAAHCDVDHVVRHPDGPTCSRNLAPLCRRHHLMKHGTPRDGDRHPAARWARRAGSSRRRWQVHRCRSGHQHWTSPLGRHYVVVPEVGLTGAASHRRRGRAALEPLRYPSPDPGQDPGPDPDLSQDPSAAAHVGRGLHVTRAAAAAARRPFDAYPAEPPF